MCFTNVFFSFPFFLGGGLKGGLRRSDGEGGDCGIG